MEISDRLHCLRALTTAIQQRREELITTVMRHFRRIRRHAEGEIDLALARLRTFDQLTSCLADREPVGTVTFVLPSNAALSNPVGTIGTAFLCGNAVEVRFPGSSRPWAELIESLFTRHLPGVRFEHGPGAAFLRRALANPEIPVIMVFGDGSWVEPYEALVRQHRKKLIFEGPGKDPFLVLAGADIERAARDAVRGAFYNAGQACTSPERFYVLRELAEAFLERVTELTRQEVIGDPALPEVTIGPIPNQRVLERITAQLADARARGAQFLVGGGIEEGRLTCGTEVTEVSWVEPTVLSGVDGSMKISREETLGPILPVQVVDSPRQAIDLATDTPFGLAACLYGGSDADHKALAATHGLVFHNEIWLDYFARELHAPYGGRKSSGWVWAWEENRFIRREGARRNVIEFSRPVSNQTA